VLHTANSARIKMRGPVGTRRRLGAACEGVGTLTVDLCQRRQWKVCVGLAVL